MSPTNGLRIAVPRGALLGPTLDALDGLGVDTSEVRSNDRKLLFEDVGIITMRPSDVPTYVEAGAADVGITGKDVLKEQPRRVVELLDLGYGGCTMVLATVDGPDPAAEALRRLGVVRVDLVGSDAACRVGRRFGAMTAVGPSGPRERSERAQHFLAKILSH